MSTATSAAELAKLVGKANDAAAAAAAGEDAAAQERCLDILRALLKAQVTAKLLKDTDAGKRVNRLAKSADKDIAEAAGKVVAAWRSSVRKQAEAAGGPAPSASLPGVSSAPSLGALTAGADSGSEQQEAASAQTVQPPQSSQSQQQQQQQQQHQLSQHQQSQQQQQQQQQQQPPPPGSKQPPRTGDPKRDKIRGLMLVGLAMVPPAAYSEQGYDPANVAAEVETAIFHKYGDTGADYSAKVRSIYTNLKDPRNPDLRRRVMTGEVDPQELVSYTPEEMASDEQRRRHQQIRQEVAADLVRGQQQAASTDMFTCARCKQKKCTYYQLQTRSADEPMTTFVTCVNCNNKWKFC